MRVLVTGATGFVGQYVVPAIAQRGHTVRALIRSAPRHPLASDLPPAATGSAGGFSDVETIQGDLLQPETLRSALRDVDAVVHLAISLTGNRGILLADTIKATTNLCEEMVSANVTRIVHCSSRAVYDWAQAQKTPDESAPIDSAPQFRDD